MLKVFRDDRLFLVRQVYETFVVVVGFETCLAVSLPTPESVLLRSANMTYAQKLLLREMRGD